MFSASNFIAGVYQYVEDELVILGDVLHADVSRAKMASVRFAVPIAEQGTVARNGSENNSSKVDQELRERNARASLARYIFPVKAPPVILIKSMVAWVVSILSKRTRCGAGKFHLLLVGKGTMCYHSAIL